MSALIQTPDPRDIERIAYQAFVRTHADAQYLPLLDLLYRTWDGFNAAYFGNRLRPPHISIGCTAPRRMSHCRRTTNYGGALDIMLAEGIAFGTNTRVVRNPWPAEGLTRFLEDLLLGETVKQFVLEIDGTDEEGYGRYGPRFAAHATRIGASIGLPEVSARRRFGRGAGLPVAAFWPWAFRPEGYYLGDIRLDHTLVGGRRARTAIRRDILPGMVEYFLFLLDTKNEDRHRKVLGHVIDAGKVARSPALARVERGPSPRPVVRREWLHWNCECVRLITQGILDRRAFDAMPILADALEDAGCDDRQILDHCRLAADHTANCWALQVIRSAAEANGSENV